MSFSVVRAIGALRRAAHAAGALLVVGVALSTSAAEAPMLTGPIHEVFVNGGPDTVNGGQSCFSMANLPAACRGVIAIPNRNKDLLAAALMSRARGGDSLVYFVNDPAASFHCPGIAFTNCAAISVSVR